MEYLSVKNFERYQHYHNATSPKWIKLYMSLLDNDDLAWWRLSDSSKLLYLFTLLLAGKHRNAIPYDNAWLTAKIPVSGPVDFTELLTAGFVVVAQKQPAQSVTDNAPVNSRATLEQVYSNSRASLEQIRLDQDQDQEEDQDQDQGSGELPGVIEEAPPGASGDHSIATRRRVMADWNEVAVEIGAVPQRRLPRDGTKIHDSLCARCDERDWLDDYPAALERMRASPFLRGETKRDAKHAGWKPTFAWFLHPETVGKIIGGRYDARSRSADYEPDPSNPFG